MVKSLLLLAIDTVCSNDVSLLLRSENEIPDDAKILMMSILSHDKGWNLLEIEKISDPTLFGAFKNTKLKCPSCAYLLKDKKDIEALYNKGFNKYRQRKRMRLAIDRQHFCTIDGKFICENCKSVCSCYCGISLCQSCKEIPECEYCNGKCYSSCHQPHYHDHSDEESEGSFSDEDKISLILCPLNKHVKRCSKPFCGNLLDLNCKKCDHPEFNPICDDCDEKRSKTISDALKKWTKALSDFHQKCTKALSDYEKAVNLL